MTDHPAKEQLMRALASRWERFKRQNSPAALKQAYYTRANTHNPMFLYVLGSCLIFLLPASLYGSLTGMETIPGSHPVAILALIGFAMGPLGMILHAVLWTHGRYVQLDCQIPSL
jgi:hypothetical protein